MNDEIPDRSLVRCDSQNKQNYHDSKRHACLMSTLSPEIRLHIYELLLPPGPWSEEMKFSFHDFFKIYHIDEEIRMEAQQLFDRELQKICFEVRINNDSRPMHFPTRPFDVSLIRILSIEIFSAALGKWGNRTSVCDDDREPLQSPQYFYREENLVGETMVVLELVKLLHSAMSLTQLSVTFLVKELEESYGQDDTEDENSWSITTLSIMKTLADPFKVLRGINRPRLAGICSLQKTWNSEVKISLLNESDECFRQYKTGWEETLARLEHSSGLSDVEIMYYQLLRNRDDILDATSQLGSVRTAWDWTDRRGYEGSFIYNDILVDTLAVHLYTVSDLLLDARWARDNGNARELRRIDEEIVQSFQVLVKKGDDLIEGWIEERKQAVEYQCSKRRKFGAGSFTVEDILTPS